MRHLSASAVCLVVVLCPGSGLTAQKFPEGFFNKARLEQGEALSRTICGSCHLWPAPDILDRNTWLEGPMPWMMGVVGLSPDALPRGVEGDLISKSGSVLTNAPLTKDEFGKILAYYLHTAPTNLSLPVSKEAPLTLKQFSPRPLAWRSPDPAALLVKIDQPPGTLLVGDGGSRSLHWLNLDGTSKQQVALPSPPVALQEAPQGLYLACVGSFSPSERPKGSVVFVPRNDGKLGTPRTLLKELVRPVYLELADLNRDGKQDIIVCGFGWYSGRLSWFEHKSGDQYLEHELLAKPGALRTGIHDVNNDGRPDIAVLFAQASEKMSFFLNDGQGEFNEKVIFQKHPAFGHSYFEFADMNGDGRSDLITVNGDNGDYPSPPKPYHGIRIYLNQGEARFEESWFHPMPGATKAVAKDFDGDGDLDLACISYYADFRKSQIAGFTYLENLGGLKFRVATFAECAAGRWLTMDVGDFDGDGDADIVLGAVRKGPGRDAYVPAELTKRWKESGVSVMLLENVWKKPNPKLN